MFSPVKNILLYKVQYTLNVCANWCCTPNVTFCFNIGNMYCTETRYFMIHFLALHYLWKKTRRNSPTFRRQTNPLVSLQDLINHLPAFAAPLLIITQSSWWRTLVVVRNFKILLVRERYWIIWLTDWLNDWMLFDVCCQITFVCFAFEQKLKNEWYFT